MFRRRHEDCCRDQLWLHRSLLRYKILEGVFLLTADSCCCWGLNELRIVVLKKISPVKRYANLAGSGGSISGLQIWTAKLWMHFSLASYICNLDTISGKLLVHLLQTFVDCMNCWHATSARFYCSRFHLVLICLSVELVCRKGNKQGRIGGDRAF